jgi:hypothetical protein
MSLDEFEEFNVITNSKTQEQLIYFKLNVDNTLSDVAYNYDFIDRVKNKCNYFKGILDKNFKIETVHDLSKFKHSNFDFILDFLSNSIKEEKEEGEEKEIKEGKETKETKEIKEEKEEKEGKIQKIQKSELYNYKFNFKPENYPSLNKRLDLTDLYNLAIYLGIQDDNFINYLNFDTHTRFFNNLSELDQDLVSKEKTLRTILFSNEDTDYRSFDNLYEINNIITKLNIKDYNYKDNSYIKHNQIIVKNSLYYCLQKRSNISNDYTINEGIRSSIISSKKIDLTDLPSFLNINLRQRDTFRNYLLLLLQNFSYDNYVIAGGFASKSFSSGYNSDNNSRNIKDFDIFFTTKDPSAATISIKEIYANIKSTFDEAATIFITRTTNVINFVVTFTDNISVVGRTFFQVINIQIILRLYNSIAQVISGFDIDSCCVAYNGKNLFAMPRFVRSIIFEYNLTDPERQSQNYSQRLYKYANRGFDIAMPGFVYSGITCNFLEPYYKYAGLAKILAYYKNPIGLKNIKPHISNNYSDYEYGDYVLDQFGLFRNLVKIAYKNGLPKKSEGTILDYPTIAATINPDYFDIVRSKLDEDSIVIVTDFLNSNNIKVPILASYNLEYILGEVKEVDDPVTKIFHSSVTSEVIFKTKNVGTQLTNSFNPVDEPWWDDLYLN